MKSLENSVKTVTTNSNHNFQPHFFIGSGVTVNFNLRRPKVKSHPAAIYAIIRLFGQQKKINTYTKIYERDWDMRRQRCYIHAGLTAEERLQNLTTNRLLDEITFAIMEKACYLCGENQTGENAKPVPSDTTLIQKPKQMIKRKTTPTKTSTTKSKVNSKHNLKTLSEKYVSEFFDSKLQSLENKLKVAQDEKEQEIIKFEIGYKRQQRSGKIYQLKKFLDWVEKDNGSIDITKLKDGFLGRYQQYYRESTDIADSSIDTYILQTKAFFNWMNENGHLPKPIEQYKLEKVKLLKPKLTSEEKTEQYSPLTEEQIMKFRIVNCEDEQKEFYKNIFVLMCWCGFRKSDIPNILKGDLLTDSGKTFVTFTTQKTGVECIVPLDIYYPEALALYKKCKEYFDKHHYNIFSDIKRLRDCIRDVAEDAGLTEEVKQYTIKNGIKTPKLVRLCDMLHPHQGRHTFVTNLCLKGVPMETIINYTGHTDEKMIKQVYKNVTPLQQRGIAIKQTLKSATTLGLIDNTTSKVQSTPAPVRPVTTLKRAEGWRIFFREVFSGLDGCNLSLRDLWQGICLDWVVKNLSDEYGLAMIEFIIKEYELLQADKVEELRDIFSDILGKQITLTDIDEAKQNNEIVKYEMQRLKLQAK